MTAPDHHSTAEPSATAAPDQERRSFYDRMWRSYGELDALSPAGFHRRRVVTQIAERVAPGARSILEVGCGQGELLRQLARRFSQAQVSGADLSAQSLCDSRRKLPAADLFRLDLSDPDFDRVQGQRSGQFDLVVCCEVIEHVAEDVLALRRLRLLLAPGAHLILTVPAGRMSRFDRAIGHQRHYRPGELKQLLARVGLHPVKLLAWGFPFHNLYRSAVRVGTRLALRQRSELAPSGFPANLAGTGYARGYALLARLLTPLFYLNLSRWGEQLIAVARRGEE